MSKHVRAWDSDHEMVRSTLDNLRTLKLNGCTWDLRIEDTGRTGVLCIVATAYETLRGGERRQVARYQHEWPNVEPVSLSAELFRCAVKIAGMVDEWANCPF